MKQQIKANISYFNRLKKDTNYHSQKWGYGSIVVERDDKIDADTERAVQNLHALGFGVELHNNLFNGE